MKEQFQNQLLQSRIEVQEQTFHHISRELHDNVAQLLSSSRMLLGLTERSLADPPDTLKTANATLAEAINELRSLSRSLDNEWLARFRLEENLENEINRINAGDQIRVTYEHRSSPELPADKQIILFRIVQEALQNAVKHSSASAVRITSEQTADSYLVSISDNGNGFHPDSAPQGLGLKNMQQRTALLGGSIEWKTGNEKGTTVKIKIPVDNGS